MQITQSHYKRKKINLNIISPVPAVGNTSAAGLPKITVAKDPQISDSDPESISHIIIPGVKLVTDSLRLLNLAGLCFLACIALAQH